MNYFESIKSSLQRHIDNIKSIPLTQLNDKSSIKKIQSHLDRSIIINDQTDIEEPKKLKEFIEYLNSEGRFFGWSFPENKKEEICENSFWHLKKSIDELIGGMTAKERLYYFGYLDEFQNLPLTHKSARDAILRKLFL